MTEYVHTGLYYDTLREARRELSEMMDQTPETLAKALHMDPVLAMEALMGWAMIRMRYSG